MNENEKNKQKTIKNKKGCKVDWFLMSFIVINQKLKQEYFNQQKY